MSDQQLTILLTLRRRHGSPLRWLAYANHIRLPFRVRIADATADDRVAAVLAQGAPLPHIEYDHVRGQADFHATVADALRGISTPFVALSDVSDFFFVAGLQQAVTFLRTHPDYAACGGQTALFQVAPGAGATGEDGRQALSKGRACVPALDAETARGRIRSLAGWLGHPVYSYVRRTASLAEQFAWLRDLHLADDALDEHLLAFLTTIAGKVHQLRTVYVAKPVDAPETGAGAHAAGPDSLDRLFVPSWSSDFSRFVDAAAAALAEKDGVSLSDARRAIVEAYRMAMAPALVADLMKEPTATLRGTIALGVTRRLLALPETHPVRRLARAAYRNVRWISPDVMQGTEMRGTPVAGADGEIAPIHEFLTGRA